MNLILKMASRVALLVFWITFGCGDGSVMAQETIGDVSSVFVLQLLREQIAAVTQQTIQLQRAARPPLSLVFLDSKILVAFVYSAPFGSFFDVKEKSIRAWPLLTVDPRVQPGVLPDFPTQLLKESWKDDLSPASKLLLNLKQTLICQQLIYH